MWSDDFRDFGEVVFCGHAEKAFASAPELPHFACGALFLGVEGFKFKEVFVSVLNRHDPVVVELPDNIGEKQGPSIRIGVRAVGVNAGRVSLLAVLLLIVSPFVQGFVHSVENRQVLVARGEFAQD
jgi:hypothetical protein